MNTARFDMNERCCEVLRIFSNGDTSKGKFDALKKSMQQAMASCDRSREEERLDHGALLIFLCAIDDLEKYEKSECEESRAKLFMAAVGKLRSAEIQYDRG